MRMGRPTRPTNPKEIEGLVLRPDTVRRVIGFARPYTRVIVLFVAIILATSLVAVVPPLIVRQILDDAIPANNRSEIWLFAGLAVAAALVEAALMVGHRWCSAVLGENLIADLRIALYDKVQRLPLAFFTRTPTGAITSRLGTDVVGAQTAVTSTIGSVVSDVLMLVVTLSTMLLLEWRLTLIALVVLPLFVIPANRVGFRLQTLTRDQMELNAQMNTQMTERFNVAGASLVKLFGSLDRETAMFASRARKVAHAGIQRSMVGRTFYVALGLVAAVGAAAIYGVGGQFVVNSQTGASSTGLSAGTLVALAALVARVYGPLTSLTNARVEVMTSLVSFERVFEVLDASEAISDHPDAVTLSAPAGRIRFENVDFVYPSGSHTGVPSMETQATADQSGLPTRKVLDGLSLTVEPGQTVALVGASGAGKSTLVSLIPRLYDVTSGKVTVDGHDVRHITLSSLRSHIGVVPQDPHLFHETIGDNLRYARPDATDEELFNAASAARIHDTIVALPDGYDTVVGERGYRLSGGEKQRLAIARLLLKDPAIMVLDEATSHLDNDNEVQVQASFDRALTGRTAIVIAHRLSTVRSADQIAVLHEGKIVELGSHEELERLDGHYAAQLKAGALTEATEPT